MLREITKAIGRYRVGNQHDYPRATWARLATGAKMPLDKFSVSVEVNPVHQSSLKSRPKIHTRLGATS